MKFKTQFDNERVFSDSGNPEYPVYSLDSDGEPILVETRNRFDEIQSHRASVELATLLQKYANGDESVLNRKEPIFGDFTDSPSNLQEWFERYKEASAEFDRLPERIREAFDNNAATFWTSYGSEDFADRLSRVSKNVSGKKDHDSSDGPMDLPESND